MNKFVQLEPNLCKLLHMHTTINWDFFTPRHSVVQGSGMSIYTAHLLFFISAFNTATGTDSIAAQPPKLAKSCTFS